MKIELYPKVRLETAWKDDEKRFMPDAKEPPSCLRCGRTLHPHLLVNALSRYADVYICQACGIDEALRDAVQESLPLKEWDAVKSERITKCNKNNCCYLTPDCSFEEIFSHTDKQHMQTVERPVSEIVYSRSDYDGSQWWTTWQSKLEEKPAQEVVAEIDDFQYALFKLPAFKTLDTMKQFCRYAQSTTEPTEYNLYSETRHLYIWIRLITRERDYNVYVHYYNKGKE